MTVYTAVRWGDDPTEAPEVSLFDTIYAAADWIFDFQGGEEEDCKPARDELYAYKVLDLGGGFRAMIYRLYVEEAP